MKEVVCLWSVLIYLLKSERDIVDVAHITNRKLSIIIIIIIIIIYF
jgi:hypothetical protein